MAEFEVIVVDDDAAVADSLGLLLEAEGYEVRAFTSAAEFLAGWRARPRTCLLLDQRMPGMDGLELLARLMPDAPPTILVTGDHDQALAQRARAAGVVSVLTKPIDFDQLLAGLERVAADFGQAHA